MHNSKTSMKSGRSQTLLSKMTDKYSRGELQTPDRGQWEEIEERPIEDEKKLLPYFYIDRPV